MSSTLDIQQPTKDQKTSKKKKKEAKKSIFDGMRKMVKKAKGGMSWADYRFAQRSIDNMELIEELSKDDEITCLLNSSDKKEVAKGWKKAAKMAKKSKKKKSKKKSKKAPLFGISNVSRSWKAGGTSAARVVAGGALVAGGVNEGVSAAFDTPNSLVELVAGPVSVPVKAVAAAAGIVTGTGLATVRPAYK